MPITNENEVNRVISLRTRINRGEIDINNRANYFRSMMGAFLYHMNRRVMIRDKYVPHFVLNTGDDTMYVEALGQDHTIEPIEQTNANNVTSIVPKCIVEFGDVASDVNDLSSPYARGAFEYEHDGDVYGFNAEFRRLPIDLTCSMTYYLDTMTDCMMLTQFYLTNIQFHIPFKFTYLGQEMLADIDLSDLTSFGREINFAIDGDTTDNKSRVVKFDIHVRSNMPFYKLQTVVECDRLIRQTSLNIGFHTSHDSTQSSSRDFSHDGVCVISHDVELLPVNPEIVRIPGFDELLWHDIIE